MSSADDLTDLFDSLGAAGTAAEGLEGILGGLSSSATSTGEALGRTGGALRDASGRFTAAGEAAKAATPAVLGAGQGAGLAGQAFGALQDKASGLLQSLVPTSGALGAVADALKSLGPEGELAAIALGVLVTVVTGLAQTLWDWSAAAVAAAQKRDALKATFDALGAGAGAGEATLAATTRLASELPFVTGQVNAWAKSLMAAGLQGAALEQGIRAVAAATAIMGESGGAAAQGLIKRFTMMAETSQKVKLDRRIMAQLAEAGVSADTLAAALGVPAAKLGSMSIDAKKLGDAMQNALVAKGGPALENLGLTWDSIKAKFNEGLGSIFAGMSEAVKPLMIEVKSLFAEFNKGAATTGLAKGVMTSILTAIFSLATKVVNGIHAGFLMAEIAALKVYIALAPLVRMFRAIYSNAMVLTGIKAILALIAAPFVIIGIIIASVVAGVVILGAMFVYVGALVVGAVSFIAGAIVTGLLRAIAWLGGLATSAKQAASNFIAGLVGGITSGAGAVADAVKNLASQAMGAFTSFFGIKSPSTKMKGHGINIDKGAEQGIDAGAGDVQDSMESMLDPSSPPKPRRRGGDKGQGRGREISFNNCTFWGTTEAHIRELVLFMLEQEAAAGPES